MAFSLQQLIYHNLAPAFQSAGCTKPLLFNCVAPIAKQRITFQAYDIRYLKKLVYLRSYHGKRLDALAEEVRRTFSRFPRTTRIVFDHRGLGDAFPQFLAQPWIDPESGKEYPPWTLDDERTIIHNAVPILRSVKASAQINQQLVSCLRVA